MKARFVGDPNDNGSGPEHVSVWGLEFEKGEWTDVGDDARFAGHSHFETADGDAKPRRGRKADAEAVE